MKTVLFGSVGLLLIVLLILVIIVMVNRSGDSPTPVIIGGCSGTRFGCCPDGMTPRYDPDGTNCIPRPRPRHHHRPHMVGGCAGTRFGCCPGSSIAKANRRGTNC